MSKSNRTPFQCKICSVPTYNSFYGVKSCEPCKVFFRRNITNHTKLKCDFDGQCQININTRHICAACRLKKCLEVGMCPEMIRPPSGKKKKNVSELSALTQMASRGNKQPQKIRRLNLLEQDQSLLSIDEWTLLSNLIHSYDEHNSLSIAKNFNKELDSLHPKLRFKINSKVIEFATTFYQASEPFIQSNHDFASLPSLDRSIVLRNAVENISCLGGCLISRESGLITNLAYRNSLENIYGPVSFNLTLRTIASLDQNIQLVKLALAISAFCTCNCTLYIENAPSMYLTNKNLLLRIQNQYAEAIWKYLLYSYKFEQAVIRFSHLVKCLLTVLTIRTHLQDIRDHTDLVETITHKIEQQQLNTNDNSTFFDFKYFDDINK